MWWRFTAIVALKVNYSYCCLYHARERKLETSRGLAVMHSTQTNVVLGSRPTVDHWLRQEGHPVLNARARAKKSSKRHPPSPKNWGKRRYNRESRDKGNWSHVLSMLEKRTFEWRGHYC